MDFNEYDPDFLNEDDNRENTEEYKDNELVNPAEDKGDENPPKHAGLLFIIVAALGAAFIIMIIVLVLVNKTDNGDHEVHMATTENADAISSAGENVSDSVTEAAESTDAGTSEENTIEATTKETETENSATEKNSDTETDNTETEEERIHRTVAGFLDNSEHNNIVKLIENYYECMNSLDIEGLDKLIITDDEQETKIDGDNIKDAMEVVEKYKNIDVFILKGLSENSFIAYVSYDIKFYNIDTLAPSLSRFYVVIEDEKPYIFSGKPSILINSFINASQNNNSVSKLAEIIDDELSKAKKADGKLAFLLNSLG